MTTELTAIRTPGRKWHRPGRHRQTSRWGWTNTRCGLTNVSDGETAPLSQTVPADRCRTCWPTPKDVTP
jgi:hypothetical protein